MLLYRKIDSTEHFIALQRDINTINNWTKENHHTLAVAEADAVGEQQLKRTQLGHSLV